MRHDILYYAVLLIDVYPGWMGSKTSAYTICGEHINQY